jgi:hypothetical protein
MKATLNLWLSQNIGIHGVLAGGLRYADGAAFSQSFSTAFPQSACDNALRLLLDIFRLLQARRLPGEAVRIVYENAVLHAARRKDGICLGVFTLKDVNDYDEDALKRLLDDFLALPSPGATGTVS